MFENPYVLSPDGMKKLAEDLSYYANVYLPNKCEEFIRRLAQLGLTEAQVRISMSPIGLGVTVTCDISREKSETSAMFVLAGPVKESDIYEPFYIALAVEFGTGITFNGGEDANPYAMQLGLGPGSYGQGKGADPGGWTYYDEKHQRLVHTYGVPATMPLYGATLEMQRQIAVIAREVFK